MIPNNYIKISTILTVFVLLAGGTANSFHSVMAQTPDNSSSGTAGTNNHTTDGNSTDDKRADRHALVIHMEDKWAAIHNMTKKIGEEFNATHNMTAQMKLELSGLHNMSENIGDRFGAMHNNTLAMENHANKTALMRQTQEFNSVVKQATKDYNDAIKKAYDQANAALKQARDNMTSTIKQVQQAVLDAKKASANTTSTQTNSTQGAKYNKANTVYKDALKQYTEDYKNAVTNAVNAAKANVTQIQQGLKTGQPISISSRDSADKAYFDVKATEVKTTADAAFTLRENSIQAMITGFASVTGDNPTLDSAAQTYTSTVNNIMQTFNAAVDSANSAAQSAIDTAANSK